MLGWPSRMLPVVLQSPRVLCQFDSVEWREEGMLTHSAERREVIGERRGGRTNAPSSARVE